MARDRARHRDQPVGVRLQSVRRLAPRRARPATPDRLMLRARDVIRVHMGHYTVPPEFPRAPNLQGAVIVVAAYLVRHPDGPILLDTGFATGHPKAEALFHPVIRPFDDALRELGLCIAEVRAVAN